MLINPLTHDDFKKYLDDPTRQTSDSEKNITGQGLKLSEIIFEEFISCYVKH